MRWIAFSLLALALGVIVETWRRRGRRGIKTPQEAEAERRARERRDEEWRRGPIHRA